MTAILSIISAKGGVGKTTLTANLSLAMRERGHNIIAVDGNITTPNLGLHLGIPLYPVTLHDVLKGKAHIKEAIYDHPSGLKVIPASLSASALSKIQRRRFQKSLLRLTEKKGYILVDGAAGLGREARTAMRIADGILIVTNPELPAVTDALKAIKIAEKMGVPVIGTVVNRVARKEHEMGISDIEEMLDREVIMVIDEDPNVPKSISLGVPILHYKPRSRTARKFRKLAATVLGESYREERSFLDHLFGWMR